MARDEARILRSPADGKERLTPGPSGVGLSAPRIAGITSRPHRQGKKNGGRGRDKEVN